MGARGWLLLDDRSGWGLYVHTGGYDFDGVGCRARINIIACWMQVGRSSRQQCFVLRFAPIRDGCCMGILPGREDLWSPCCRCIYDGGQGDLPCQNSKFLFVQLLKEKTENDIWCTLLCGDIRCKEISY